MNINQKYRQRYAISLAAVAVGALLLIVPAFASASTGLTIQPVKVLYTINPGQTVTGIITLTNAGNSKAFIIPSVQDFVPTAGSSNISFVGKAPGVTSVEDWVGLVVPPQGFYLDVNETKQVSFTITAPKDAEPGSHFGVDIIQGNGRIQCESSIKSRYSSRRSRPSHNTRKSSGTGQNRLI